jgi:hypothetical protein
MRFPFVSEFLPQNQGNYGDCADVRQRPSTTKPSAPLEDPFKSLTAKMSTAYRKRGINVYRISPLINLFIAMTIYFYERALYVLCNSYC